jgi:hypothetical protein
MSGASVMSHSDRTRLTLWTLLAAAFGLPANSLADEPSSPHDPLRAAFLRDAQAIRFALDGETPLTLEPAAVMSWASPDDWKGDIFLWTKAGRPEIVGSIIAGPWSDGQRLFYHEFHALTTHGFPRQNLANGRRWELAEPGIVLRPVPDAPVPADSEPARLRQMRALAREFAAHSEFDGSNWELRLLPQPVYRYRHEGAEKDRPWLDGALFTYVLPTGTDAEVLLILEARPVGAERQWQYAVAQMTNRPAWMLHRDQEIWRIDRHTESSPAITRPFTTFYAGQRSLPTPEPQP